MVYELGFQCMEEALHRGIVPAIAAPAHARSQAIGQKLVSKVIARVLGAAVRVKNRVRGWLLVGYDA